MRIIALVKLNAVYLHDQCFFTSLTKISLLSTEIPFSPNFAFCVLKSSPFSEAQFNFYHIHKCFPAHLYPHNYLPHFIRVHMSFSLIPLIILTFLLEFIFLYDYSFLSASKNLEEIQKQCLLIICGFSLPTPRTQYGA